MSTRQLAGWLKEAIRVGEQRDNLNPSTYKEALHILTSITNKKTTDELAHIINELQRVTQTLTVRESVEQALIHREKLLEQVKTAFEKILAIQKEVYLKREHITVELFTQYFESLIRIAQELIKIETELLKDEQIILKVNEEIKVILDDSNFVLAIDKYINHHENINLTNGQKSQFQHFVSEYKDLLVHEDEIKASIDSLKHDLQELGRMYNRHHTDSVEGRFNDQSIPHFLTDTHKASADIKEHFTDAFNKKVSEQTKQYIQFIESLNTQSAQMLGIIQTIYQHEVSAQQDANQGSQELPSFDYDPSEHLTTSDEPEQAEETSDNNTAVQADEEAAHMQEQESDENSQASEEESARLQAEREVDETLKKRIRELVEKLDDDENTIISLKDKITELQSKTQDEQWSSQMQTYLDSVEESVTHMKAQNTARTEFDHYDSYLKEKEKRSKELEAITSGNKILSFKELLKIQSYNSSITTVSKFNTFSEFVTILDEYASLGDRSFDKQSLSVESKQKLKERRNILKKKLQAKKYQSVYNEKFISYDMAQTNRLRLSVETISKNKQFVFNNMKNYEQLQSNVTSLPNEYSKTNGEKPGETAHKILTINNEIRDHEKKIRDYLESLKKIIVEKSQ